MNIATKNPPVDPKFIRENERLLFNESFFFEGSNGKSVLLVHGWTSTSYEVRKLGEFLNASGYTVYAPLLRGHGTRSEDLESVKWSDWLEDVEIGYGKLKKDSEKVFVVGTSIGATLAILLAAKISDVSGIILLATPFRLRTEMFLRFMAKVFLLFGKKYYRKYYPPTFGSSGLVTRLVSYQTYPVVSVIETFRAVREARKMISNVIQPCLVMQSTSDHIVHRNSLEDIFKSVNSSVKRKKYIPKSYHTFIADINNEHVFQDILDFIEEN